MNSEITDSPLRRIISEEQYFDAVFVHSPTGIVLTDSTGKFLDVNDTCATILGYSRSELIGKSFQEITHQEDILCDMQMFNKLLNGLSESYEMTKRFIQKGGNLVWVKIKVNSVRKNGETTHLLKHIVQMYPMVKSSNALVNELLTDSYVKKIIGIFLGLFIFTGISSVITLLHIMGFLS